MAQWEKIHLQRRRRGSNLWVGMIPWKRKWQPTPVFLPGKSHGQRSLAGSSPWGRKRVRHDLATKQWKERIIYIQLRFPVPIIGPSVQFSHSVMSDSLRPQGPQHARPPCSSPTPRVYSNSCPLSWGCHPTISSSVIPFSSSLNLSQHQGLFK